MVAKHLAMALLGSALIAAPALAQTSSGSGSTTSPSTNAPAMNNTTGSSSTSSSSMNQMHSGQWRSSKIEGLNVYNQNNEKIGDISEMLIDQSGKVQAVVVGVGGFLGIGERDVAIAFDQVKFMNEPRANASAANTNTGAPGTATTTAPSTTGSTATGTAGSTSGTMASKNATDNADRMAPDHAVVSMTKEQLQGMPEFKMNR